MPETVFSIASTAAMVSWVALIAARFIPPLRRWIDPAVGYVVPALLAVAYTVLLVAFWGRSEGGGFSSLAAVAALCASLDVPCEVSLETPMACGYGVCLGCPVARSTTGFLYACTEGPCIDATAIAWKRSPK